jgi:hypothetical protein
MNDYVDESFFILGIFVPCRILGQLRQAETSI